MSFSARKVEIQFLLVFLVERANGKTRSNSKTDQPQHSERPSDLSGLFAGDKQNLNVEHKTVS